MGSCLQRVLGKQKSSLRHESLIKYEQLTTILKPSTINDQYFYSSHNLCIVEQFLDQFSRKPGMQIDYQIVNYNMNVIANFIRELRDKSSAVGQQFCHDQLKIKQYVQSNKKMIKEQDDKSNSMTSSNYSQHKLSDVVMLRLEIQILLLGLGFIQDTFKNNEWDLFLQIQELIADNLRKAKTPNKQTEIQIQPIQSILINSYYKQSKRKQTQQVTYPETQQNKQSDKSSKKRKTQSSKRRNTIVNKQILKKVKDQNELQEIPILCVSSKVVNKNSKIKLTLYKIRNRKKSYISCSKKDQQIKNNAKGQTNQQHRKQSIDSKNRIIIGQTCLSVSDFIYYNSLIVSDVIALNSVASIKSSISTTTSQGNSQNVIGFLALRGQGLQGHSLDKDYLKIIKQHEVVLKQLQHCLQGQKGWEKLSQYKDSAQSQRRKSVYSQYSVPQGAPNYKI